MFRGRNGARAAAVLVLLAAAMAWAQSAPGLINYQGRLFDDAGLPVEGMSVPMAFSLWDRAVTQDPVVNESVTMSGTSPIPLARQNLVSGTVVVTAVGGSPVYETPRDYTVDFAAGTITRVGGGFILDGTPVEVDYVWTNSGNQVWSESQAVEVTGGLYNVVLGQVTPVPASIFSTPDLFLEVAVNGETLSPRAPLTSVPYALNAELLDGMDSADFALFGHSHDFFEITGAVTDAQVPDDITVLFAADAATAALADDSALLDGFSEADFVHVAGDTVTGSLQVNQQLQVGQDLAVLGGHVGIGAAPGPTVGITNRDSNGLLGVPVNTGAAFSGAEAGVVGSLPGNTHSDPLTYAVLASPYYAVYGAAEGVLFGTSQTGGWFEARSSVSATGVRGSAWGGGATDTYGVKGEGRNSSGSGPVYGGHFTANPAGTGNKHGVYGECSVDGSGEMGYGVRGFASSTHSSGNSYGGYFQAGTADVGNNYGIFASGYDMAGWFQYGADGNRRVQMATQGVGVDIDYISSTSALTGVDVNMQTTSASQSYSYKSIFYNYGTGAVYGLYSYLNHGTSASPGYGQYTNVTKGDAGGSLYGSYVTVTASDTTSTVYGVDAWSANTRGTSYGVRGISNNSYGTGYGVYGAAHSSFGTAYAVYAEGDDYGLYATALSSGYAGYFNSGRVRVGNSGVETYVDGSGDLYVADELEVDGTIYGAFEEFYYKDSTTDRYYSVSMSPSTTGINPWYVAVDNVYCSPTRACYAYFPVNLPERATITAFRVWGATSETSHNFTCNLTRRAINAQSAAHLATVTSTTTAMTLSTFAITWPYVDNANMNYIAYCEETDNTRTNDVRIFGIQIAYTVDGPE